MAFAGSDCVPGNWYADDSRLCFSFARTNLDTCWLFYLRDGRLFGTSQNSDGLSEITEIARGNQPLACAAMNLGV